jgi:hypothetical protein
MHDGWQLKLRTGWKKQVGKGISQRAEGRNFARPCTQWLWNIKLQKWMASRGGMEREYDLPRSGADDREFCRRVGEQPAGGRVSTFSRARLNFLSTMPLLFSKVDPPR